MNKESSFAPVVVFAFNRIKTLKDCIKALLANSEAVTTDLFVFVDGPRANKEGEAEKVEAVRDYVKSISGFKSLTYHFSKSNKKLGPSIIAGVTEVINEYDKAIIVEDDLIVANNFLSYMNQGLDLYKNNEKVFSVCGYTNKVNRQADYPYDAYFCVRSSSWGWATWKDRWESVDWELKEWNAVEKKGKAFNHWGGSDCFKMLKDWKRGKNHSWAIRFCFAEFVQNRLSLFPMKSLVNNAGFDGQGTNCRMWSRFKFEMDESGKKLFILPKDIIRHQGLFHDALKYHTIKIRIYSRIMYLWYDIKNAINSTSFQCVT